MSSLVQSVFLIVFTYDFEQVERVRNELGAYKLNFLLQVIHEYTWKNLKMNRPEYEDCGLL